MRDKRVQPTVSVVIVNYNGKTYTQKCIKSIEASNPIPLEICVVDNGSSDGSCELFRSYKPTKKTISFRLLELDHNYGPAYARNRGVEHTTGTYISFLDNDTEVHPDWAQQAIKAFESSERLGIIQSKLLLSRERNKIDYVGEYIGQNGFLVQRAPAGTIDTGQFETQVEILAAKSAGMFIRRSVFEKVGGFDDDYFIYVEETDLGWRSWLAGYAAAYVPESIVYHEFGTSTLILGKSQNSYNAKFHGSKNYILTLFKNLGLVGLGTILPVHILLWIGLAGYAGLKGEWKNCFWVLKGIAWNIWALPRNIRKRKLIQSNRTIPDKKLFPIVMRTRPFTYFVHKAVVKHSVGNAESF